MDIVAESLSANILKARNVTVRGQDVLKWFESKLSASVSFVGVFDDLSAAPARNGAVAIVGSKDYIYSSTTSAWQEFGDEGQIGVLTQAVAALSGDISSCVTSSDVDNALSAKQDKISVDGILSCDGDGNVAPVKMPQNISDLSNDVGYLSVELEPAFAAVSSTFLTAHQNLSGYYQKTETSSAAEIQAALSGKQPSGNYLTGEEEPAFAAVSSTFLTAHQDLSGYYRKTETSSAAQLQALQNATGVSIWSDPYQANDNATDPTGPAIWFYPRVFGAPSGAYINTITIHTTATKPEHIPGTNVYARIYQEGEEANPLADSWPVNVVSVDTPYTFNLKKEVPLDSNRKYGVRFYRSDNSNVAVIGYHLYAYHKTEGGPYPNPGTDIAYGAWNDTAGKNLLRPALSVSWTAGIQHQDFSSDITAISSSLSGAENRIPNELEKAKWNAAAEREYLTISQDRTVAVAENTIESALEYTTDHRSDASYDVKSGFAVNLKKYVETLISENGVFIERVRLKSVGVVTSNYTGSGHIVVCEKTTGTAVAQSNTINSMRTANNGALNTFTFADCTWLDADKQYSFKILKGDEDAYIADLRLYSVHSPAIDGFELIDKDDAYQLSNGCFSGGMVIDYLTGIQLATQSYLESNYVLSSEMSSAAQLEEEFRNYYRTNETSSSGEISAAFSALRRECLDAVSGAVSAVYLYGEDEIYGG